MRKILFFCLLTCLCACTQKETFVEPQPQPLQENALAKVAGYVITQEEFDKKASFLDPAFQKYIKTPQGKQNFLNYLISERLLQQEALFKNLQNEPEYQQKISDIIKQQEENLQNAKEFLLRKALMEDVYNQGITYVSEEEIKAYHKKYPYEIKILQIILNDAQEAAQVMNAVKNIKTQSKFQEAIRQFSRSVLLLRL